MLDKEMLNREKLNKEKLNKEKLNKEKLDKEKLDKEMLDVTSASFRAWKGRQKQKGLNYDYTKLRKEGSRKHEALHA